MKKRNILSLVLSLTFLLSSVTFAKAEENEYPLTDSTYVRILGRGEVTENESHTFNWPASGFEFEFSGEKAEVFADKVINLDDTGFNGSYFNTAVYNGDELVRVERVKLSEGWNTIYEKEEGDPETKKIMFIRSSESLVGTVSFAVLNKIQVTCNLCTNNCCIRITISHLVKQI